MEINVALPTVAEAQGLARRLAGALGATVSVDLEQKEINVLSGTESNDAILRVVDIVDDWLEEGGIDSARLSLGARSFTLVGLGQTASFG